MATLKAAIPILPADDMTRALAFYTQKLGFKERFRDNDQAPKYVGIERDGIMLHLVEVTPAKTAKLVASQTMCRLLVDDVDALYAGSVSVVAASVAGQLDGLAHFGAQHRAQCRLALQPLPCAFRHRNATGFHSVARASAFSADEVAV
ncbi:MAG: VOC family protein, partial [Planctomycetaceae bacterium]|nr:VOC family protein [Planctomycetaceae bacterium]